MKYSIIELLLVVLFASLILAFAFGSVTIEHSFVLVFFSVGLIFFFVLYKFIQYYNRKLYIRELIDELQLAATEGKSILDTLKKMEETPNKKLGFVIKRIRNKFEETGSLSSAIALYPRHFSHTLRKTIFHAEQNQILKETLAHFQEETRSKALSSHILFLTGIYFCFLSFLALLFLPRVNRIHEHLDIKKVNIPKEHQRWPGLEDFSATIRMVDAKVTAVIDYLKFIPYEISGFLFPFGSKQDQMLTLFVACILFMLIFYPLFYRFFRNTYFFHTFLVFIPFRRKTIHGDVAARYCKTLGVLLAGNIPLIKAHEMAAKAEPNKFMQKKYLKLLPKLEDGESLTKVIETTLSIPQCYKVRLIQASLSKTPAESFQKTAKRILTAVTQKRLRFVRLLYPILVLVFGFFLSLIFFNIFDALKMVQHATIYGNL